jgi:hypothetical protein
VRVRRPEIPVHFLDHGEERRIAFDFLDFGRAALRVQVVALEVHDVVRKLVLRFAVFLFEAADEYDGERDVRETTDHLVHPARDATCDIGEGAFEQQADVRFPRFLWLLALHADMLLPDQ